LRAGIPKVSVKFFGRSHTWTCLPVGGGGSLE
jgi:hypothetical protein